MPGGWEWLIIIGVLLLLFGAKRLPEMARSVGQSARVFKGEMKGLREDEGRTAPQQRSAELPPASGQQHPGQQYTGQQYDGPVNGSVNGAGTATPQEPVRRDADR
jgi:sec-independent protein translocase protein TatA